MVWREPVPGRKYVHAVDTSQGLPGGDFGVGLVLDAETCDLCAGWRERCKPIPWGRKQAMLGWHYNNALMAIETYPSATGYAVAHEAIRFGYRNLYQRTMVDQATREVTKQLGFHTNATTKPMLIARVHEALEEKKDFPWDELVAEIGGQRYDANRKMVPDETDDIVITLGIALMARDDAWTRNELKPEDPEPVTIEERVWASVMGPPPEKRGRMAC